MGGTVGIEASRLEALDYEAVKASGLAFGTAHNALQKSLKRAKSTNVADDQTTIHFLAIRQLSHNLKNQKVLEKTRHRVLKTKSVPHNVKYRQHSFECEGVEEHPTNHEEVAIEDDEAEADLNHDDLDLVHDDEYYNHHHRHDHSGTTSSSVIDDGPPWKFHQEHVCDAAGHNQLLGRSAEKERLQHMQSVVSGATSETTAHLDAKSHDVGFEDVSDPAQALTPAPDPAPAPSLTAPAKARKPRPVLSLQLTSDAVSSSALPLSLEATVNSSSISTQSQFKHSHSKHDEGRNGMGSLQSQVPVLPKAMPPSPSANVRVSPRGTLYMGKWKVMETGIFPDESRAVKGMTASSSFGASLNNSHSHSHSHIPARTHNSSQGNLAGSLHHLGGSSAALVASSFRRPPPAIGGKRDFLEINTLGSGASGVVSEAIHLPSLTIVALKMLPVYNQEKRQHVSRELGVLYKNLAELRLVDDSLYQGGASSLSLSASNLGLSASKGGAGEAKGLGGVSSPHILSLYNAFVDPKSGMINLVIEYMDGGSLEDLVQQGGCKDEKVLADIAYQTIKGLSFLHANKNVHRDIKPANILCSTSGLIKIGDFGISKALDKTSGFANSFVGTVSYMSPERISGEKYSFSCDVWSLGLTLLAVAKGRFPLKLKDRQDGNESDSMTESTGSPQQVVGGAAGYWAMIKAICDDEPPRAGPNFSPEFNSFIAACLKKDPDARLSCKELLSHPFIEKNATTLKLSLSDLQARRRKLSGTDGSSSSPVGVLERDPMRGSKVDDREQPRREIKLEVNDAALASLDPAVPPSPLTTHLANSAIERRASKDYPIFESPSNRLRKSVLAEGDPDSVGIGNLAYSGSSSGKGIPEEDEDDGGEGIDVLTGAEAANDVIIAIRLEHLDRVLDRIAYRLEASDRKGRRYSSASGDDNEDGVWVDDDDEETPDRDLTDVHQFGAVQDDSLLHPHDSIDSMDKLLHYKDAEPSPPPLQLPTGKFKRSAVDTTSAGAADLEVPHHGTAHSDDKTYAKDVAFRDNKIDQIHFESVVSADAKEILRATKERKNIFDDKHDSAPHGILKGTSTLPHHVENNADPNSSSLMRADEKKAIFAASRRGSGGSTAFNSNRSVHFSEGMDDVHVLPAGGLPHSLHLHAHPVGHIGHSQPPAPTIHVVAEGSGAEAEDDMGETAASALSHPSLPKTSSYFVQSHFDQLGQRHPNRGAKSGSNNNDESDNDADSDENDAMAVVDHAIAVSEAVSQAVVLGEPPAPAVDYKRMLPKLNSRGLVKWENLARQLHLPLHLVKLAVRSRLGSIVDLEAEDSDDEYEVDAQVEAEEEEEED